MNKEQTFLLSLLAAYLGKTAPPAPPDFSETEWKSLIFESLSQAVGYLTFSLCQPFWDRVPASLSPHWNRAVIQILGRNRNAATAQNELTALLGEQPYVILKGLASAAYYPDPALRDLGDVDFLAQEEAQGEIAEKLLLAGYHSKGEENDHHTVFKKPFCHLELHREPPGIPGGEAGGLLRAYFGDLTRKAELQTLESDYLCTRFLAPAPAQHGLILLLHMQHHMTSEGLGLRHLLDWGFFVAKTHQEPFWQTELLPLLEQTGLLTYAAAMTKTCARYLGCPEPDFCRGVPEDLCRDVMEDIFSLGTFGAKDRGRSHAAVLTETNGGAAKKSAIGVFHGIVMAKHPVLRRVPILYPIFAGWEFLAYCFGALTGKRTRLSKLRKAAKQRQALYRRLAVFQIGNPRTDHPADSIS